MTKPTMLFIGGINGAGKSSVTDTVVDAVAKLNDQHLIRLNADERKLELQKLYPKKSEDELSKMAADEIDAEVADNIENRRSFYVETVLSSEKYQDDVTKAKTERGFDFFLVYVSLKSPELAAQRVKRRVEDGGHDVPFEKIFSRYPKSHKQLEWFAEQADMFLIFDNSALEKPAVLLAEKMVEQEIVQHVKGINPTADDVIQRLIKSQKNRSASSPRL